MKLQRKWLVGTGALVLALLILAGCVGHGHHHASDLSRLEKRMVRKLDLNEAQQARLKPLLAAIEQGYGQFRVEREAHKERFFNTFSTDALEAAVVNAQIDQVLEAFNARRHEVVDTYVAFHNTLDPQQREKLMKAMKRMHH